VKRKAAPALIGYEDGQTKDEIFLIMPEELDSTV